MAELIKQQNPSSFQKWGFYFCGTFFALKLLYLISITRQKYRISKGLRNSD